MYQKAKPIYLITETPLHAGSGSDLGYIDLPIQREKHTGYPKVESSGLKGALRQAFEAKKNTDAYWEELNRVFGYDEQGLSSIVKEKFEDKKDFAGALGLTDARILLFPVKSLMGTFAWITCRRVLTKFYHELEDICNVKSTLTVPTNIGVSSNNLFFDENKKQIQLEEYIYTELAEDNKVRELAPVLCAT